MSAAPNIITSRQHALKGENLTLLELVQAVCETTTDDREVVATVQQMLRTGRVRLIGNFRGAKIDCFR